MTRLIDPEAADKLAKLLGMTGSSHDGEALNAARMADRLRRDLGLQWSDIIAPPLAPQSRHESFRDPGDQNWRAIVRYCADHIHLLDAREGNFVRTIARWHGKPTDKQMKWLRDIADRLRVAA